ncbi:MAG: hypothetical protein J5441_06165 [Clostridia bacterium]|nr:hypothetical protein [Clostridia bacterium]
MEFKDLAPWIAITITLALSILVPLFTQIANNCHQRKLQQEKFIYEERQKRINAYEYFLSEVGAAVTATAYQDKENFSKAGSAIHKLYAYAPIEWYDYLDTLTECVAKLDWNNARPLLQKLAKLVKAELNREWHR